MQEGQNNRHRNTYLLLIAAGVYLLVQKAFGFPAVIALAFILFGLYAIRSASEKKGYVLLGVGAVILLGSHFTMVVALVLISLGFYFIRSRQVHRDEDYMRRQKIVESLKWNREPYVLRSMSLWSVVGEMQFDLTLAILEDKEVTVVLQGIIGDIDVIVPEYLGISVECSVLFGQADVGSEKQAGLLNKIAWRSPNFDASEHKLKLVVSYFVGDVDIKVM